MSEYAVSSKSDSHQDPQIDLEYCYKKGDIIEEREDGFDWPLTMVPNIMVIVRVPDREYDPNMPARKSVYRILDWEVVVQNAQGKRIRVWNTDTSVTYALTRQQVETFIVNHGGEVKSVSQNEVIFDMPNTTDFEAFKQEVREALEGMKLRRRYSFSETDVDQAITAGGIVTLTNAQFLSRLLDKAP